MIDDILDYVDSYDSVRAVCGLSLEELPDEELGLVVYLNYLGLELYNTSGVYSPSAEDQTLIEIFSATAETDPMHSAIQLYSIYTVADCVLNTVGLKAYKTMADGKSTLTRFSPEATFMAARASVKEMLSKYSNAINKMLGSDETAAASLTAVKPLVDPVTGA